MDTIVRVKSVGVLGLSSKITTFVIDIELDGGKLKIEDQLLHFKNSLRTSYREYDESLAIVNNKAILSNLDNAVKPNELHALVDDYIDSVWVTDANKNTTKQRRASLGLHNPTIKDKGVLKEALLSEVKLAYKNYINQNVEGVLGILPPYIAKPSEAPVCRGL